MRFVAHQQESEVLTLQTENYLRRAKDTHTDQSCPGLGLWGFGGVLRITGNVIFDQQQQHF